MRANYCTLQERRLQEAAKVGENFGHRLPNCTLMDEDVKCTKLGGDIVEATEVAVAMRMRLARRAQRSRNIRK